MAIATFDGPNLRIVLTPPVGESVTTVQVAEDIYSAWKDWMLLGDNSKYPQAMRSTGGDDLGGGQTMGSYIFLENQNGWRIQPAHEDATLHVFEFVGNLFPADPNQGMFEWTAGVNVVLSMMRSSLTTIVSTGGSALTQDEHNRLFALPQTTLEPTEHDQLMAIPLTDAGGLEVDERAKLMGLPDTTLTVEEHDALTAIESEVALVKSQTDRLPGSIGRGRALAHFHVLMVASIDHRTPATGLTIEALLAKDGAAGFVALAGAVVEIGSGVYDLSLTADETDCVSGTLMLIADGADTRYLTFVTSP